PAVIHLVSNLVENGPQAELVFGSRGGNVGGDRFSKSYYMSNVVDTLSVSQLGGILSAQEPSPLIVLDVPAPPAGSERLRQLFLRNAFAAEWSAYAHALPAAVLATGLGDSRQQERLIESLANLLREERSIGEIAVELRGQVAAQDLGSRGLRSGGLRGLTDLLPFAGTALFTDRPERVFPMGRQVKS
ncbi:MAG: hypothetical protein ACK2U9_03020, partial [Anaerolineae bacterium]